MFKFQGRLVLWVVGCLAAASVQAEEKASLIGRQATDFTLRDSRGQERSLHDFRDRDAVVVVVLGVECPLAKAYGPRLAELARQFADRDVQFLGVDANTQDSLAEIAAFARQSEISFPLLKDANQAVADMLGATRTPEAFVLDGERRVRYHGRIDDQFAIGRQRPEPTRRDLAEALTEVLDGQAVSQPVHEPVGCLIGRNPKEAPQGGVTYSNRISRLFQDRCVRCHRAGEVAPFPLSSYEDAAGWGPAIQEVVNEGRMPPWFANPEHGEFKNDARLSDEEKRLIDQWVADGCPQGDPAEAPAPREFTEGWQISRPDQIVYIADEPVRLPAEGVVEYKYFRVDPGWKEDKWIKAAESRPDNRGVVHHIVAIFMKPGEKRFNEGAAGMVGFAPGMPPAVFPEGSAIFVPAGSQILFQMHYTPNGKEQFDRSSLGLVFAEPSEVKQRIAGGKVQIAPFKLKIAPLLRNQRMQAEKTLPEDLLLVTLTPHMHLRGQAFKYEAFYPDGRQEVLLDIPRFDFNWQLRYDLKQPKLLPKDTKIVATALFDNSSENIANPDPNSEVRWGDQTWEEMMIGYFTAIRVNESASIPGRTADATEGEAEE